MYVNYYYDSGNIDLKKRSTCVPEKGNSKFLKTGAIGGIVLFAVFLFGTGKISEVGIPGMLMTALLFAAILVTIYSGRLKEKISQNKTKKINEMPVNLLCSNGGLKQITSSELRGGDIIIVNSDEMIPAGGVIIEGFATIDEAAITGVSAPVLKDAWDENSIVYPGTKIVSGKIKIQVEESN